MRWRTFKNIKPPRGRQVLVYDPALRGRRDVLDDGTRLGYYDGLRLRAAADEPAEFQHWLPYDTPPRLLRMDVSLSGEMLMVLDKLRTAYRRGALLNGIVDPGAFDIKLSTLRALVRRGALRQVDDRFLLLSD